MLTELVSLDRAGAWLLRWFEPLHVPGLLQTQAYARAVFEADDQIVPEEVERRLADRMESQSVLYADPPLRLVAVIDEGPLRRRVGLA